MCKSRSGRECVGEGLEQGIKSKLLFYAYVSGGRREIKLQLLTVRKRVKIFSKENVAVEDISYDQ